MSTGNSASGCLITTTTQLIVADRISTDFALLSDNALERVLRIVRAMHDARMLNGVLTKPARKAYLHIGRIVETLCSMCDATKDCLADIRTERG